jgi:HTH-type transcriptional regulator / antitoxin HigA
MNAQFDVSSVQTAWREFEMIAPHRQISDDDSYRSAIAFMNDLLYAAGDDEEHPLMDLISIVSEVVANYEDQQSR